MTALDLHTRVTSALKYAENEIRLAIFQAARVVATSHGNNEPLIVIPKTGAKVVIDPVHNSIADSTGHPLSGLHSLLPLLEDVEAELAKILKVSLFGVKQVASEVVSTVEKEVGTVLGDVGFHCVP